MIVQVRANGGGWQEVANVCVEDWVDVVDIVSASMSKGIEITFSTEVDPEEANALTSEEFIRSWGDRGAKIKGEIQ
jgi:hypothetical protein